LNDNRYDYVHHDHTNLKSFRRYVDTFKSTFSSGIKEPVFPEPVPNHGEEEDCGRALPGMSPFIELKEGALLICLGSNPTLLSFAALNGLTVFHSLQEVQRPTHLMCSTPHWSQKNTSLGLFDGDAFIPDRDDIIGVEKKVLAEVDAILLLKQSPKRKEIKVTTSKSIVDFTMRLQ
jgi:hypothetical protein